jgi:hypothetical protein
MQTGEKQATDADFHNLGNGTADRTISTEPETRGKKHPLRLIELNVTLGDPIRFTRFTVP